ncbi:MAG: fibronectin type III domain-containing protein [Deltaproteobacteria bacterium]
MKLYIIIVIHSICFLGFSQSIIVKPYLTDVTHASAIIMLETNSSTTAYVDYGSTPNALNLVVTATSQSGNGNTMVHTALISGLSSGTKYYYKVRLATGIVSDLYNFTTYKPASAKQNINLISISDTQMDGANPSVFANLINQGIITVTDTAIGGLDNLHGIIIPGDLVQDGGNYNSWRTTFFVPAENISGHVPLYPALGNHDLYNNGLANYIRYFDLPTNGPIGLHEQVWYKDISNIRLISLNSNSGSTDLDIQLSWLQATIDAVCANPSIDFIILELHHPYHSELWTPGELEFTGRVITILETWSTTCNKISAHLFGHTHAYSRGQSRDHQHVMVNVATAAGAIDNWGEFPNADYPEYNVSQDEYGFVLIQTSSGTEPSMRIRRFGRGDQNGSAPNPLRDEIIIKFNEYPPAKPSTVFPNTSGINPSCVFLRASVFNDAENLHQATHWQYSTDCTFNSGVINIWRQHENWYNEVNTQANDLLIDETLTNLNPNTTYCWRVRYRDGYLKWSPWSDVTTFTTGPLTGTVNLLVNAGAESGINNWIGQIESLTSNECGSVPVYAGLRFFGVGGICANEISTGFASQVINVDNYASQIDNGQYHAEYSAYMRTWAVNNDMPEMYLEFIDVNNATISTTVTITNNQPFWMYLKNTVPVPLGTRKIKTWLKGTRLAGTDNDSYFDELSVKLVSPIPCASCAGAGADNDGDKICEDLDCNDNDATCYPGALELCDSMDNNCDGIADSGVSVTFTGNIDDDWNNPDNWSQGMIPLPCQRVIIPTGKTVVITQNTTVNGLTVNGVMECQPFSVININGENGTSPVVEISGTLNNHGKLIIKNSNSTAMSNQGIVNNTGRIYLSNNGGNDIVLLPSGTFINTGDLELK